MEAELEWRGRSGTARLDGAEVAVLHRDRWRERAEVTVDGRAWRFGAARNVLRAVDPDGVARHRAESEGTWRRRWTASLDGRALGLARTGWSGWRLLDPAGSGLGELQVRGLRSRVSGELPPLPADAAVFVLWCVHLLAARTRAAAATGAGA